MKLGVHRKALVQLHIKWRIFLNIYATENSGVPLSSSIGRCFHDSGIISLLVWKTNWLLINFWMLEMVKGTSGWTILKYWSKQMPMVWRPGTIFWMLTPACFTLSLKRKYAQGVIIHILFGFRLSYKWSRFIQVYVLSLAILHRLFLSKFSILLAYYCKALNEFYSQQGSPQKGVIIQMLFSISC